uniref:Nuclear RNA export factor 2-like n=1 Tax=Canis lupus familiaris TaxID=9615 RepID=A0A8C0N5E3_CANLF
MSERQRQQKYVLPCEKDKKYRSEEYNDGGSSPQGRKKEDLQRRVKWHNEGHIHITLWRYRKNLKREVEEDTQDGMSGSWFKITIPYGRKYDKAWLMNSIQRHCSVPFVPVDFHYIKNQARFFVQEVCTASALKDVSYKICDEENWKISIFVNPSSVPYSVRYKLEPEEMEQLKLTMNKRFDVSQQALDLQSLRFDPDLVDHDIDIILNRRNCMAATLQITEENFPELLSLNLSNNKLWILNLSKNELNLVWELNTMKGLNLEELWLEGNPLCDTFPDKSTYISAIRDCFPKLLRLDGQDLTPPDIIDTDMPYSTQPSKESYKGSEELKNLVLQFLQRYYLIYDSGNHQGLLGAYHDEACFSLAISFKPKDPVPSNLCEYFKENRNMKNLKDFSLCVQLLKHTKYDILCSLYVLPKTQHDLSSFMVDMWFQMEKMICFSVSGVFKEVEGKSQGFVRAFTRNFIATPVSDSTLCIVNDELFVRDATPNEIQSVFSKQEPTLTSSSMVTLSQEQQEIVQAFSTQSGMKLEWSQKCLQENEWNYTRAGQIFTLLVIKVFNIPDTSFPLDVE